MLPNASKHRTLASDLVVLCAIRSSMFLCMSCSVDNTASTAMGSIS